MVNLKVVNRYVHALILAAGRIDCIDQVQKAVKETEDFLRNSPEAASVLYHPSISRQIKKQFFSKVFGSRHPEIFRNFIELVIDKKREKILEHIHGTYRKLADQINGIIRSKVKSPSEISSEEKQLLSRQLEKLFNKKIILEHEIADELIGGLQVRVDSYIIDGSVKTKLQNLHRFLNLGVGQLKKVS